MPNYTPLDDPKNTPIAWDRYWRLMRGMFAFTIALTILVLGIFYHFYGLVSIHFYIATGGAIIASLLLASALMGLVFISSGSGHDEAIDTHDF